MAAADPELSRHRGCASCCVSVKTVVRPRRPRGRARGVCGVRAGRPQQPHASISGFGPVAHQPPRPWQSGQWRRGRGRSSMRSRSAYSGLRPAPPTASVTGTRPPGARRFGRARFRAGRRPATWKRVPLPELVGVAARRKPARPRERGQQRLDPECHGLGSLPCSLGQATSWCVAGGTMYVEGSTGVPSKHSNSTRVFWILAENTVLLLRYSWCARRKSCARGPAPCQSAVMPTVTVEPFQPPHAAAAGLAAWCAVFRDGQRDLCPVARSRHLPLAEWLLAEEPPAMRWAARSGSGEAGSSRGRGSCGGSRTSQVLVSLRLSPRCRAAAVASAPLFSAMRSVDASGIDRLQNMVLAGPPRRAPLLAPFPVHALCCA